MAAPPSSTLSDSIRISKLVYPQLALPCSDSSPYSSEMASKCKSDYNTPFNIEANSSLFLDDSKMSLAWSVLFSLNSLIPQALTPSLLQGQHHHDQGISPTRYAHVTHSPITSGSHYAAQVHWELKQTSCFSFPRAGLINIHHCNQLPLAPFLPVSSLTS